MSHSARRHPDGAYRYLPAIDAYSAGVAAEPGHAIIGLQFTSHLSMADALVVVDEEIARRGLPATSLAALQLRVPEVMSPASFAEFNAQYLELLDQRGLLLDGMSPLARTNVVPVFGPPSEAGVFAAFLSAPREGAAGDFVVAGSGEAIGGVGREHIAAFGDLTQAGLRVKAEVVAGIMLDRLGLLGADGSAPSVLGVYTAHEVASLPALLSQHLPASERMGFVTYASRPPVVDVEFEMDCLRVSEWHVVGAR